MTPPLGPKLGKFLNLDYFEIFVPPFTLSKTIPKSYLTVTLGLFQSYISHICKKFAYISPIYDPFIILIKAIFQSFEFEKNMKIKISHPSHSNMHFELWTFYLHIFVTFCILNASLSWLVFLPLPLVSLEIR